MIIEKKTAEGYSNGRLFIPWYNNKILPTGVYDEIAKLPEARYPTVKIIYGI